MLTRAACITPFVWGHRGIGKSSVVRQVCHGQKIGFVDMRCSQMEASDLRGLPDRQDGRTVYLPPAEMPIGDLSYEKLEKMVKEAPEDQRSSLFLKLQPRLNEGILFLDELNRAQDDVLQAIFQLVLDRKVGQYVLPDGWSIVCAGNFNDGSYITNGFTDAAFLDRFCHLTLSDGEPTLGEWVEYMANCYGQDASAIIEFASHNLKHLDGTVEGKHDFVNQPSRRSWDAVIRVKKLYDPVDKGNGVPIDVSEDAYREVLTGLLGADAAMSFLKYDCPVKPRDVISMGVKKLKPKLDKLSRGQMSGLLWGLVGFVKPKLDDDKVAEATLDFAEWCLNKSSQFHDLVVGFVRSLTSSNSDPVAAAISNPQLASLLANAAKKSGKKNIITRINERPTLQKLLSRVAWGSEEEEG